VLAAPLLLTPSFHCRLHFRSKWGVLDFAGGIVIHTSAGIGSLVAALYLGRRKHFYEFMGEFPPSNLPLAATGAALLWIGWFGFNGGSALASGPVAVSAIVSTQVGCSCGAFTWLVLSWWKEKPQAAALLNGALAGLAGITPASGYINTPETILMGCIFGVASFYSVVLMKHHLHIDDALDVSSIHGLTGLLGSLAVGFFAQDGADGLFYGNAMQLAYQVVGVLVALVYPGIVTYGLLRFLDKVLGGIRAPENEEEVGLDWSAKQHARVTGYRIRTRTHPVRASPLHLTCVALLFSCVLVCVRAEHHEIAYHKLHVLDDTTIADEPHFARSASMSAAAAHNLNAPTGQDTRTRTQQRRGDRR
jgi:ammonia channel protein AmtB